MISVDRGDEPARLALFRSPDAVGGHLVLLALRLGDDILTDDPDDPTELAAALGPAGPRVHRWAVEVGSSEM